MTRERHPSNPIDKKKGRDVLNHMVDFGTEPTQNQQANNANRIKRIVKKLQDISRRIDFLASLF